MEIRGHSIHFFLFPHDKTRCADNFHYFSLDLSFSEAHATLSYHQTCGRRGGIFRFTGLRSFSAVVAGSDDVPRLVLAVENDGSGVITFYVARIIMYSF